MHHWFADLWFVFLGLGLAIVLMSRRDGPDT